MRDNEIVGPLGDWLEQAYVAPPMRPMPVSKLSEDDPEAAELSAAVLLVTAVSLLVLSVAIVYWDQIAAVLS